MEDQNTNEDLSLDSSEALSGLLSVVNALCRKKTENNNNKDDEDDDSSCNDIDNNGNDAGNGDGESCSLEPEPGVTNNEIQRIPHSPPDSPSDLDKRPHPAKRQSEPKDPSPIPAKRSPTIDVPTYSLDETRIVIFPDVYAAVRKACGTCSSLRSKINKLGIVAKRFQPWEMTSLKHVGAIGLEVKCCSYISFEEFIQIIQNYKDGESCPDMFNFLSAVNLTCMASSSMDERIGKTESSVSDTKSSRLTSSPIHTFIVDDEVVVCTVELQQVFEALFGKVFCVSLTKLGVFQKKFTPCQLDEVMDFVDIDESSVPSASFYVSKKDGERVFRYAEALFNVDQVTVRWMEPLKLTYSTSLKDTESSDSNFQGFNAGSLGAVSLERAASLIPTYPSNIHSIPESSKAVTENKMDEGTVYCLQDTLYSSSDESPVGSPNSNTASIDMNDLREVGTPCEKISVISNADNITAALTDFQAEDSPSSSFKEGQKDRNVADANDQSGQNQALEACVNPSTSEILDQSASSSGLYQANEEYPSSPDSEASNISELGACSSIRTYQIDGHEVVCIPDIHKIVIHLYGQSVQVGYYLQRLQIPTQRFSTVHVKRLKALNALNSKATLCTYILKSDAQRLLKMYDVFCTESKLQQIQWCSPVSLDAFDSCAIPFKEDAPSLSTESLRSRPTDPIDIVKIPTFKINGEVVVSVPDAHKVVQVLNGQSVQVRYNMDKLGIVKRKYSYSQVYQLRAISDLKRPSMCTFITKTDADKLLAHYLTAENAARLNYIQWLPPVQLEELNTNADGASTAQDAGSTGRGLPMDANSTETVVSEYQSAESNLQQKAPNYKRTSDAGKDMDSLMNQQRGAQVFAVPLTSQSESSFIRMQPCSFTQNNRPDIQHSSEDHHQSYRNQGSVSVTLDSNRSDESPSSASAGLTGTYNQVTTRDCSNLGPLATGPHKMELHDVVSDRDSLGCGPLSSEPGSSVYSSCDRPGALSTVTATARGPCGPVATEGE